MCSGSANIDELKISCGCCMQHASYDSVKFQVVRLMRMLVQICQTLDVVPSEVPTHALAHYFVMLRWLHAGVLFTCSIMKHSTCGFCMQRYLFMKMIYHDDTPGALALASP